MTLEELVDITKDKRILRHKGQCFFNVYSDAERDEWIERGAFVHPFSQGSVIGHEVHLHGMLDPMTEEDEDGEMVDVRQRVLLDFFRVRDGFAIPLLARAHGYV